MLRLQSALGIFALLLIAWALAENRRAVSLRQAAIGLVVTFVTAAVLLKLPVVAHAFGAINDAVGAISAASRAGSSFVFGYIGGGPLPFDLKVPGADFILAFQALPVLGVNGVFILTGVPAQKRPIEVDADQVMRDLVLKNQLVYGTVNAGRDAFEAGVADLVERHGTEWLVVFEAGQDQVGQRGEDRVVAAGPAAHLLELHLGAEHGGLGAHLERRARGEARGAGHELFRGH